MRRRNKDSREISYIGMYKNETDMSSIKLTIFTN